VQCGAVWCSVVQCGAVCCSVVQCGTVWYSVVQCGAVWCSVVQCGAVWCNDAITFADVGDTTTSASVALKPTATHCNPLQHTVTHCVILHLFLPVSAQSVVAVWLRCVAVRCSDSKTLARVVVHPLGGVVVHSLGGSGSAFTTSWRHCNTRQHTARVARVARVVVHSLLPGISAEACVCL